MPHSCADCGETFTPARADAAYCSSACRQRAYRTRNAKPVTDRPKARRGTTGTNNRNNDVAPVTAVSLDWDSIPGNQREKLNRAKQAIRREVEREYNTQLRAEVDQYKTQTDRSLADYKAKLKAEADVGRARRDEERTLQGRHPSAPRQGANHARRLQPHPVMPAPG